MSEAAPSPAVRYVVRAASLAGHRWRVEMHIAQPHAQQCVSLPVWVPGSYLVREFSRFLDGLRAECGGKPCALERVRKNAWQVDCAADSPLVLHYEVTGYPTSQCIPSTLIQLSPQHSSQLLFPEMI